MNVPVSVTTVWAEAVVKAAARKSAAEARSALRPGTALFNIFLDMEILLDGLESDINMGIVAFR